MKLDVGYFCVGKDSSKKLKWKQNVRQFMYIHGLRRELDTLTRGVRIVLEKSEQYEDSWKEGYGRYTDVKGKTLEDSEEETMYFKDFG